MQHSSSSRTTRIRCVVFGAPVRDRISTLATSASSWHNFVAPGRVAKLVTLGTIGAHRRFGGVLQWSSFEFEVHSEAPVAVGLDGEALTLAPPLRFVSLPGALRVRVPRHASGVSPAGAAVTLTRRNLRKLVRIAAGRPADLQRQDTAADAGR